MYSTSQKIERNNQIENIAALKTLKKQGITFVDIDPKRIPKFRAIANKAIARLVAEYGYDQQLLSRIRVIVKAIRK